MINNCTLQQMQLLIVDANLLSPLNFTRPAAITKKNFAFKNYILESLVWNKCDSAEVLTWQT